MIDTKELREKITTKGLDVVADTDILVVLDRLEEAESDALEQARLNGMGSEREAALMAKLEAAEKERDALRARIEAMEKQEPVAEWTENRFHRYPQLNWADGYRAVIGEKLYTLPGAKGE